MILVLENNFSEYKYYIGVQYKLFYLREDT